MANDFWETLSSVGLSIVGVATLAVVVSRNSNTTGVISAVSGGFSQDLATALSPVAGSNYSNGTSIGAGTSMFPIT
jgi:hypothetical protein